MVKTLADPTWSFGGGHPQQKIFSEICYVYKNKQGKSDRNFIEIYLFKYIGWNEKNLKT